MLEQAPVPQLFDSVLTTVPAFVLRLDSRGRILFISRLAKGYQMDKVLGSSAYDFIDPRYHSPFRRCLTKVFSAGQASDLELEGAGDDGQVRWYSSRIGPVIEEGKPASAILVATDITDLKRAQEGLKRSRESYRVLFDASPVPMWLMDLKSHRILEANEAALRQFGYARSEFLEKRAEDIRPRSELPRLRRAIKSMNGRMRFPGTWLYLRKDGSIFEAEVLAHRIAVDGRGVVLVTARDVTTEHQLRLVQQRFSSLFNSSRDGLSFVALDGTLLEINLALCRMLGYRRSELLNRKTFLNLTAPEYHAANKVIVGRLLRSGGSPVELEKEYIRKDGTRLPASVTIFRVDGVDGKPMGTAAIVRDISERKRLEREILEIGAREQSRIGRELHDSLGQYLTGISFLAKSLKARLAGRSAEETRAAERIAQAAIGAVEQVRALAAGLVPAELLPNGLPASLRALCIQAERTLGLQCSLTCPKPLTKMEDASLLHLYRIAQEAVINAAKHSGAESVRISLRQEPGRVVLQVRDDGIGLRRRGRRGLGLRIMEHRARMLGGTFEVQGRPGGGTTVVCSCPVRHPGRV